MADTTGGGIDSDDRSRDLVAVAADWSWASDREGYVDFLSPNFAAATDLPPGAFLGRHLVELANTGSVVARSQHAAIAARAPFRDLLCKIVRPDRAATWLEITGTPGFADGNFSGYRGVGWNATARVEDTFALQRYRQLSEATSDWFWETDDNNVLTYVSPNVEAVLGQPVSAYIGKRLADTVGVTIEPEAGRASLAAIKARIPYQDFRYSRILPGGRIVWVTSSGVPFHDENGIFRGYRGIARDATAQVEAERKIRDSEQRFRQMFEIYSDYYWERDAQHRLTFVSPESFHDDLWGVPAAELYGKRISEFLNVSISPEMGKKALKAHKARLPYRDLVISVLNPGSGKTRWISLSGAPAFDAEGDYLGDRGVGVEITARIEAEVAARLAQHQLHDAVAHVSQPFALFDADEQALAFNQAFADLYRTPTVNSPVYSGVSFRTLAEWQLQRGVYATGPGEPEIDLAMLFEHYRSGLEHTYRLSDGRWMMVIYRPLPGTGRVALWTDITAIKQAEAQRRALEAQLHHAQRLEALGTLAGGAAHEINNALIPVLALTKIVARKLPEDSRERRNLETVMGGAERARDLVQQILAFSRKEDETPPQIDVDIANVLQDALPLMRATLPASIQMEEDIAPTPPITGDPNQLHQVIINLVANAAQAIGQAVGSITVSLRQDAGDGQLRLSVADTGCGMDEATLGRIFEPFFTTKKVGEGTGLGLSVVQGIIQVHGGRIEVQSTPGCGSRFDIFLPLATARAHYAA
jgi:PAS domain S-box-containing protein